MKSLLRPVAAVLALAALQAISPGCSSPPSRAGSLEELEREIRFPPPPPGIAPLRLGVPRVVITGDWGRYELCEAAAGALADCARATWRFETVDRVDLVPFLAAERSGPAGTERLIERARLLRLESVLLAKVIDPRVRMDRRGGFALDGDGLRDRGMDPSVVIECGVDLVLLDPERAHPAAACFREFQIAGSAGALGITVLGMTADPGGPLLIPEEEKVAVLRLALKSGMSRMMADIDEFLLGRGRTSGMGSPPASLAPSRPAPRIPAPKKFCESCGAVIEPGGKSCKGCGAKL